MGFGSFVGGLFAGSLLSGSSKSRNDEKIAEAFNDLVSQMNQKLEVIDEYFVDAFSRIEEIEQQIKQLQQNQLGPGNQPT